MRSSALVLLLLAAACSSSTPKAAPTATTPPPVVTHTTAPKPTSALVVVTATGPTTFTTADRTISCDVESAYARCDVRRHTFTPPPMPSDCHENWGFGVEYQLGTSAGFFCAGDSILGATRVLAPGHAIRVGEVQCAVVARGVQCGQEGASDGFVVSRSAYRFS